MRDLIEEILTHYSGIGYQRADVIEGLCLRLSEFVEQGDQVSELFALSEGFPEDMDDDRLRAWLMLEYEFHHEYHVPTRNAIEAVLNMIRARERYYEEFGEWKEAQDIARKKWKREKKKKVKDNRNL